LGVLHVVSPQAEGVRAWGTQQVRDAAHAFGLRLNNTAGEPARGFEVKSPTSAIES